MSGVAKSRKRSAQRDPTTGRFLNAKSRRSPSTTTTTQNFSGVANEDYEALQLRIRELEQNKLDLNDRLRNYNHVLEHNQMLRTEVERAEKKLLKKEIEVERKHSELCTVQERHSAALEKHIQLRNSLVDRERQVEHLQKTKDYVDGFTNWHATFEQDIREKWPRRHKSRYQKVKVLLVQWKSDDLGVEAENRTLASVFQDEYGFEVTRFRIPDNQPTAALSTEIISFIDSSPETLHIFHYAGHGLVDEKRNDAIWAAKAAGGPEMPSNMFQALFEDTPSDAILLYDSCNSADTNIVRKRAGCGVTELIAACGFGNTAPGPGYASFTNALTECLHEAAELGQRFCVSDLFSSVLARLRNSPRRAEKATPVHSTLTSELASRQIFIYPPDTQDDLPVIQSDVDLHRIMFSFNVGRMKPRPWREWLLSAPADALDISFRIGEQAMKIEDDQEVSGEIEGEEVKGEVKEETEQEVKPDLKDED
ncbi:hypothetical protein HYFRA_00013825 [Hymenoscyphus fraxineus]|uniref:Peptidase C14 caspase domain-containing protein n=1 Tax=Hymenoscyphus fraxineus TaxID=746836 RepID=A0A9N9L8D9_9HELO|nr:hypothetical protein HYFRA_00013825 [Hymenoscyphus fraxineus]